MTFTLALATATPRVGVALAGPDGPIGHISVATGRRHGETLAPAIRSLAELTGVGLAAVGRVAVATAKALGAALGVPVVPCSSLDLLAHPHRHLRRPVAAVVDARRGEVFWALYEPVGAGMAAVTEACVAAPDVVAEVLTTIDGVLVTGDGARRWLGGQEGWDLALPEYDHPSAEVLAELAPTRPALAPEKVTPLYLRGADVRIGWEQR